MLAGRFLKSGAVYRRISRFAQQKPRAMPKMARNQLFLMGFSSYKQCMSAIPPISCAIIARNEADRLGRAIASVQGLCSDVVVVLDNKSTDNTEAVARAAGARVLARDWTGYGEQKRFAEQNCQHDWILSLDADEALSPALQTEIRALFEGGKTPPLNFYKIKYQEVFPGHNKPAPFSRTDSIIRFFNRQHGMTSISATHDRVEVPKGMPVGKLDNIMYHYSIRSLAHLIEKYNSYTTLQAQTLKKKSRAKLAVRLVTEFPTAFVQYYLLRRLFTAGLYGFAVAMVKAFSRWARIAKMWELGR